MLALHDLFHNPARIAFALPALDRRFIQLDLRVLLLIGHQRRYEPLKRLDVDFLEHALSRKGIVQLNGHLLAQGLRNQHGCLRHRPVLGAFGAKGRAHAKPVGLDLLHAGQHLRESNSRSGLPPE